MHAAVFGVVPHFHSGFSWNLGFPLLRPSSHEVKIRHRDMCFCDHLTRASAPKLCSLCQVVSGKHLWKIEIPYTRNSGQGCEGKTHNPPGEPKHSFPLVSTSVLGGWGREAAEEAFGGNRLAGLWLQTIGYCIQLLTEATVSSKPQNKRVRVLAPKQESTALLFPMRQPRTCVLASSPGAQCQC